MRLTCGCNFVCSERDTDRERGVGSNSVVVVHHPAHSRALGPKASHCLMHARFVLLLSEYDLVEHQTYCTYHFELHMRIGLIGLRKGLSSSAESGASLNEYAL